MVRMRCSYFGFIKDIDSIASAGYDCVELHIKEIMGFDEAAYNTAKKKLRDTAIYAEVFDNPLPLDAIIADPVFDVAYYTDYLKRAVDRCAEMGARYFVYGNGRTRSLPPSGDTEKNDEMIAILCRLAAEANITILLEPLVSAISNRFLDIPEIHDYMRKTGIPNLKTLIDYRWFLAGGHDFLMVTEYADIIKHAHIDNPLSPFPTRIAPATDDGYDYSPFFNALKKICYKGIISIEANTADDFETSLKKGLELFEDQGVKPYKSLYQEEV